LTVARSVGTLYDLGLRYEERIMGALTTVRLNVQNVGDKHYWTPRPPIWATRAR
jgi:outer membrane receptor protein involved in Fe transport